MENGVLVIPVTCIANDVNDDDGDLVTFMFRWFLADGTPITTTNPFLFSSLNIVGQPHQLVICEITPSDGTTDGVPVSESVSLPQSGGIFCIPPNC